MVPAAPTAGGPDLHYCDFQLQRADSVRCGASALVVGHRAGGLDWSVCSRSDASSAAGDDLCGDPARCCRTVPTGDLTSGGRCNAVVGDLYACISEGLVALRRHPLRHVSAQPKGRDSGSAEVGNRVAPRATRKPRSSKDASGLVLRRTPARQLHSGSLHPPPRIMRYAP